MVETSRDAGSIPAASTDPLSATGLNTIKARKLRLAGLVFSTRLFAFLSRFLFRVNQNRDSPHPIFRAEKALIDRKALNTVTHPK